MKDVKLTYFVKLILLLTISCPIFAFGMSTLSEVDEKLPPGKFYLSVNKNKVYLSSNEANVQEMLTQLCDALDVDVNSMGDLRATRTLTLTGVSPECAVRKIVENHMLSFRRVKKDGTFKLISVGIFPRTKVDKSETIDTNSFAPTSYSAPYIGEDVSLELAKKAAIHFATEAYGEVRFWGATEYAEPMGRTEAYSILLYRGEGPLPKRGEIYSGIRKQTNIRKKLEAQLKKLKGRAKARFRAKIKESWKRISRPTEFVTVLCGAHTGHVPVITMTEGLPIEYVLLEEIENQMKHIYHANQVNYVRPVYIGPFHIKFEFRILGEEVLVDPRNGSEIDKELVLEDLSLAAVARQAEMEPDKVIEREEKIQERKNLMKKKWDFVRGLK